MELHPERRPRGIALKDQAQEELWLNEIVVFHPVE
jgi:hypothetical protein